MPAKFLLKKDKSNKYSFSLKATTGKAIISSEAYATKKAALSAIKALQKTAAKAKIDDPEAKAEAAAKKAAKKPAVKKAGARGRGRPPKNAALQKTAVKKPAAKKPAVKKAAVKKPAVKKTAGRKPAVKKTETPFTSFPSLF
jgi:uncharacterized protein YegP (UPF0339 family)